MALSESNRCPTEAEVKNFTGSTNPGASNTKLATKEAAVRGYNAIVINKCLKDINGNQNIYKENQIVVKGDIIKILNLKLSYNDIASSASYSDPTYSYRIEHLDGTVVTSGVTISFSGTNNRVNATNGRVTYSNSVSTRTKVETVKMKLTYYGASVTVSCDVYKRSTGGSTPGGGGGGSTSGDYSYSYYYSSSQDSIGNLYITYNVQNDTGSTIVGQPASLAFINSKGEQIKVYQTANLMDRGNSNPIPIPVGTTRIDYKWTTSVDNTKQFQASYNIYSTSTWLEIYTPVTEPSNYGWGSYQGQN